MFTEPLSCPVCGMERYAWQGNEGQGYTLGETTYCCQGCVEGTGCTCELAFERTEEPFWIDARRNDQDTTPGASWQGRPRF